MRRNVLIHAVVLILGSLFCLTGCGLEEYYVLDAPYVVNNQPTYSTTDFTLKYFEFRTYETSMIDYTASDSAFKFLGTAVYYRIYNNYSTMTTDDSAISSVNTSTSYADAAEALIAKGFQQLGTSSGTVTPLVTSSGDNRRVVIRLSNYQSSSAYAAAISVYSSSGTLISSWTPKRYGNSLTFDFGRTGTYDKIPTTSDSDANVSGSFSSGYSNTYFIDLYAVAVGRDATYTTYYSHVLHLGSVPISSATKDN